MIPYVQAVSSRLPTALPFMMTISCLPRLPYPCTPSWTVPLGRGGRWTTQHSCTHLKGAFVLDFLPDVYPHLLPFLHFDIQQHCNTRWELLAEKCHSNAFVIYYTPTVGHCDIVYLIKWWDSPGVSLVSCHGRHSPILISLPSLPMSMWLYSPRLSKLNHGDTVANLLVRLYTQSLMLHAA